MKLKVLVVDDSVLFRRAIADALALIPDVDVVGSAPNGKIALERVAALSPDLITLDIEMPEMDGLAVLEELKRQGRTCAVVMVSSFTSRGSDLTIKALERGAFDFITKPTGSNVQDSIHAVRDALAPVISAYKRKWEIRTILHSSGAPAAGHAVAQAPSRPTAAVTHARPDVGSADLVVIGVSTGGPNALATLLPMLPASLNAPVLIVQHMPPMFTQSLAASLNSKCGLTVKEASEGEVILPGTVYIAPGGRHMKVVPASSGGTTLHITDDPPENNCRPSVDYLFRSVANQYGGRAVAVIMTGMGSDGVLGLRLLKRRGTLVIAQDEPSCVVFGMPGEAVKAGVVDIISPLGRIAEEIQRCVKGSSS
jgi:two-component system chemotaxis response regulator CheB